MERKTLKIIDYGYKGEGVAKDNGKVYFVPKTIANEEVTCRVVKDNSKFSWCQLESIATPSHKRIASACPYFDKCGGCAFQHIKYESELEIKQALCRKEFSKICDLKDIEITPSSPTGYRNKIRFKVKDRQLGFFEEKSNDFVAIKNCLLCNEKMNEYIEIINCFLRSSIFNFDEVTIYSFENGIMLNFSTKDKIAYNELQSHFSCPVMLNYNEYRHEYIYQGMACRFEGDSFRQVNDDIASKIYDEVSKEVNGKFVVNAYSGGGVLSGILARNAEKVIGIEVNKSAHQSAENLKRKNSISNLSNICGYAEKEIEKIKEKIDCIVLDPPRAGCFRGGLESILKKEIKKIIYISCNPATLTRDLGILQEKYDIEKIKLFDMFPRTANVETLATLSLKDLTKKELKG